MPTGYQSLIVWQKAMRLAKVVYEVSGQLPREERFALADQLRRAAVSIPSNIAEGSKRGSKKEFAQFLKIAHGSLSEVETQLMLARELYPKVHLNQALALAQDVGALLFTLGKKLNS